MKITVEYDKETQIREKIWGVSKHFTQTKFENIVPVCVHLPKAKKSVMETVAEKLGGIDINTDEACVKLTGLTPSQYQAKHGVAWND